MTGIFVGEPDRIWTYDLLYRKQMLYPAELRARNRTIVKVSFCRYKRQKLQPISILFLKQKLIGINFCNYGKLVTGVILSFFYKHI